MNPCTDSGARYCADYSEWTTAFCPSCSDCFAVRAREGDPESCDDCGLDLVTEFDDDGLNQSVILKELM